MSITHWRLGRAMVRAVLLAALALMAPGLADQASAQLSPGAAGTLLTDTNYSLYTLTTGGLPNAGYAKVNTPGGSVNLTSYALPLHYVIAAPFAIGDLDWDLDLLLGLSYGEATGIIETFYPNGAVPVGTTEYDHDTMFNIRPAIGATVRFRGFTFRLTVGEGYMNKDENISRKYANTFVNDTLTFRGDYFLTSASATVRYAVPFGDAPGIGLSRITLTPAETIDGSHAVSYDAYVKQSFAGNVFAARSFVYKDWENALFSHTGVSIDAVTDLAAFGHPVIGEVYATYNTEVYYTGGLFNNYFEVGVAMGLQNVFGGEGSEDVRAGAAQIGASYINGNEHLQGFRINLGFPF